MIDKNDVGYVETAKPITALRGQNLPYPIDYEFTKVLNISEKEIPFIKHSVLIKDTPHLSDIIKYKPYEYEWRTPWEIRGDSTIIYQGRYPERRFFTQEDYDNNNINHSCSSKWYRVSVNWTDSGHQEHNIVNQLVNSVTTKYDIEEPIPGYPTYYNYKRFSCEAIDYISPTQITGTGTYRVVTVEEDEHGGIPTRTIVDTKNVTMTAPLQEDFTLFLGFQFDYFTSVDNTIISIIFTFTDEYRLFFSNKRARWFGNFNKSTRGWGSTGGEQNIPHKYHYQDNTLPYTKLNVIEYPSGYVPGIEEVAVEEYAVNTQSFLWSKINDRTYAIHIKGRFYISSDSLSTLINDTPVQRLLRWANEDWVQHGDTYQQQINFGWHPHQLYVPNTEHIEARLMLIYNNPQSFNTEKHKLIS